MQKSLFGAIAIVLLALVNFATAEEGDRSINRIEIRTAIDHHRGATVFRNGCGTLRRLQADEISRNIIACPQPRDATALVADNAEPCYEGQRGINCNCSQRATAQGLHGEARIAFRDKCIAQLKAGLSPDADGRAK